jgi:transposase
MAKLKEKEIQQRIQLYEQGYSIDEIAKKCGIQKASIRNWLRIRGYKIEGCPMEKALMRWQH